MEGAQIARSPARIQYLAWATLHAARNARRSRTPRSTVLSVAGSDRYRTNEGPPGATPFNQYRLMYLRGANARPCQTGSGATFNTCTMTEVLQLQLGAGGALRRS